eukprot:NODE_1351_length_1367_cov_51.364516_g1339_i0.p1 GENE.NODE_1351_length_1367_cov_51.364516_g1339_i0~~NODE_1351_length_1367_cov_51.364516_g1339_i0.p1  ORF type:complete len:413 (-),score=40.10 NODE_1351_length_1367_cov_51.364516_g1339_i0:40-1278(-)
MPSIFRRKHSESPPPRMPPGARSAPPGPPGAGDPRVGLSGYGPPGLGDEEGFSSPAVERSLAPRPGRASSYGAMYGGYGGYGPPPRRPPPRKREDNMLLFSVAYAKPGAVVVNCIADDGKLMSMPLNQSYTSNSRPGDLRAIIAERMGGRASFARDNPIFTDYDGIELTSLEGAGMVRDAPMIWFHPPHSSYPSVVWDLDTTPTGSSPSISSGNIPLDTGIHYWTITTVVTSACTANYLFGVVPHTVESGDPGKTTWSSMLQFAKKKIKHPKKPDDEDASSSSEEDEYGYAPPRWGPRPRPCDFLHGLKGKEARLAIGFYLDTNNQTLTVVEHNVFQPLVVIRNLPKAVRPAAQWNPEPQAEPEPAAEERYGRYRPPPAPRRIPPMLSPGMPIPRLAKPDKPPQSIEFQARS